MKGVIGGLTAIGGGALIAANTQPFNGWGVTGIFVLLLGVAIFAGSANVGPFKGGKK